MFVHGAGYLQNSHEGWSGYCEMMFHSLLVQGLRGARHGLPGEPGLRPRRRTIYRQMGHPELEDLADGPRLTEQAGVDPDRVAHGGSYGGFITFMALFQQPGCGRPGLPCVP